MFCIYTSISLCAYISRYLCNIYAPVYTPGRVPDRQGLAAWPVWRLRFLGQLVVFSASFPHFLWRVTIKNGCLTTEYRDLTGDLTSDSWIWVCLKMGYTKWQFHGEHDDKPIVSLEKTVILGVYMGIQWYKSLYIHFKHTQTFR